MKLPPIPDYEPLRCEALQNLNLLDTPQEERFDRLTRLAQQLFNVRIALISLVDSDRQWFKSRLGLSAEQTPRSISFCGHAIASDETMVIENALEDDRFSDNPLVTGDPKIRFYAGCPLREPGGHLVGTLCIIDDKPRHFNDDERRSLRDLANLVETEITQDTEDTRATLRPQPARLFSRHLSNRLSRLPMALAGATAAALVMAATLWYWDHNQTNLNLTQSRDTASQILHRLTTELESEVNDDLYLVNRLAGFVMAEREIRQSQFADFAQQLADLKPHILSLQIAPDGGDNFFWPSGGDRIAPEARPHSFSAPSIMSERVWFSESVELTQGGRVLLGDVPLYIPGRDGAEQVFWGFASVAIDIQKMLEELVTNLDDKTYKIALRGKSTGSRSNGELVYGDPTLFDQDAVEHAVSLPGRTWELALRPEQGWPRNWPGRLLFLIAAPFLVCVIGILVFYLLRQPANIRRAIAAATTQMQDSQARFDAAIGALPAGFAIYDRDTRLVLCNERFRKFYDKCRPRLQTGRSYQEILNYAINAGQFAGIDSIDSKRGEDFLEILSNRHQLGSSVYDLELHNGIWLRVYEERMPHGGLVSFHVDVTEERQKEQALEVARREAEEANKSKSTFLATVSHEVRTPLNGVLGMLGILSEDQSLDADQRHYAQTAHRSAQHLLVLLNEILDISKMEAGKLTLEPGSFILTESLDGAMDLIRADASGKQLTVTTLLDERLRDESVLADEGRLRQIVLNLLSNAVKFTDQGEVRLEAQLLAESDEELQVRISVTDTGVGFDPAEASRLFIPFEQLDTDAMRRAQGTGLGLSICKRLVEQMGGELTAQGSPGEGARFDIALKFPRCKAPRNQRGDNQLAPLPRELNWRSMRILLAEDSPTNQLVVQAMLKDSGYLIDVASNGVEAVKAVSSLHYDLVLMDVFMPEQDGMLATQEIRQKYSYDELPIIALTANAMEGDSERFLDVGMNDYLSKPVDKRLLLQTLYRWLSPRVDQSSNQLH